MKPAQDGGDTEGGLGLYEIYKKNTRSWQGFWWWRDRSVMERDAAITVLMGAGLEVANVRPRKDDPPDCEAIVNGMLCGVEVTELVHQPTLERSIQAIRAREARQKPEAEEAYFVWERDSFLAALQGLIDRKDGAEPKGGPYARYILVIVTDEFFLDRHTVGEFTYGAKFQANRITDVLLGLSYHPSPEPGGGSYPVFRLPCGSHEAGDQTKT